MQNNKSNDYSQSHEIDLIEVIRLLINSKKLIIVLTLVITTLVAIYAFQKQPKYNSTALIEIGSYDQDKKILIETVITLIEELNIKFIHKQDELAINSKSLSIQPIKKVGRLIQISYTSISSATSEKIVNEIVRYVENRHSLLLSNHNQKTENQLTNEIEILIERIEFFKNALLNQNTKDKLRISNEIEVLNNSLPNIESKIKALNKVILEDEADNLKILALIDYENLKSKLEQEKNQLESELKSLKGEYFVSEDIDSNFIFTLSQEKNVLELELELLMKEKPFKTQLVGEILTTDISTKKALIILLGFSLGLFLSIMIAIINNSLTTFKEK